jgi:hypothetical protein
VNVNARKTLVDIAVSLYLYIFAFSASLSSTLSKQESVWIFEPFEIEEK